MHPAPWPLVSPQAAAAAAAERSAQAEAAVAAAAQRTAQASVCGVQEGADRRKCWEAGRKRSQNPGPDGWTCKTLCAQAAAAAAERRAQVAAAAAAEQAAASEVGGTLGAR